MARSAVAERNGVIERHESVIAEYRDRLTKIVPPQSFRWPPSLIGPTWQRDDNGRFILPRFTIGWDVLGWCGTWLQHRRDQPWRFTDEQARFILWWMSVDRDTSEFVYHDFVLQRLKGWGKDPLGACLLAVEMLGPCRLDGWDGDDPVATDVTDAWVQTAAVSLEQTKNTMRLVPNLFTAEAKREFDIQVGKEKIYALGIERFWEAVTSSPTTIQGARATFILLNETQHWDSSNGGHDMAATVALNADKSPDGGARVGRITNAYEPGRDSVAERDREAWEKMQAGTTLGTGLLYDSLEASPDAPLSAEAAPEVVASIKGDSYWLNTGRIVQSILDPRNPPSQSRRFWYNQVTAREDSWVTPQQFDACPHPEQGTIELDKGDTITMFFDGSKSHDATGLVACRISDGSVFVLGCWQRPERVTEWTVPRDDVDDIVRRAFSLYDVVAFFCDPGAGEDDTGERYWDAKIDAWGNDFGESLCIQSVASGPDRHACMWDMVSSVRTKLFTEACERALSDIEAKAVPWDGNPRLRMHVRNAYRRPNEYGIGIGKQSQSTLRLIDLAVCMVGARMLRRMYEALPPERQRRHKSVVLWTPKMKKPKGESNAPPEATPTDDA